MAETKTSISELTAATSVGQDDLLFISQQSGGAWNSKKATVGQLPFGQGTITGITMNGASKGTSGNVNLGTVLTAHQSLTGYVPTSRKVNGKQLTADVALNAVDVSAVALTGNSTINGSLTVSDGIQTEYIAYDNEKYGIGFDDTRYTAYFWNQDADIALPKVTANDQIALTSDLANYYTKADLTGTTGVLTGYSLTSHTHAGYVPTSRTVAGMSLTGNVTLKNLSFGSKNYNGFTALTVTAGDLGALTAHQPVSAVYVNQHIRLSANNALVGDIDCSDFVKDGMLSAVELCSDQLIFIFNAESGKTAISVALSNFIDETNYYTKAELTGANGVLKGYVPTTRKVNGTALTADLNVGTVTGIKMNSTTKSPSSGIVDLGTVLTAHQSLTGYVPTSRKVAGQALTADVTAATISSAIGLGNYSLTSHTHSNYVSTSRKVAGQALTADVTAAQISSAIGLGGYYKQMPFILINSDGGDAYVYIYNDTTGKNVGIGIDANDAYLYGNDEYYYFPAGKTGVLALTSDLSNYYTKAELTGTTGVLTGYSPTSHAHGSITNAGAITDAGVALANGDSLAFVDSSDSGKVKKTSITFDGSTTTQFLSKKGTFQTALTAHQSLTNYYTKAELTGTTGVLTGYSLTGHTHSSYVPTSRTVAGKALTANITAADLSTAIGLGNYSLTSHTHSQYLTAIPSNYKTYADTKAALSGDGYVTTARKVAGQALTADVTAATISSAIGLGNYSLTSHTHSNYVTGVKVNGTTKSPSSGIVDLGTVLTAHQSLTSYYQKTETSSSTQLNTAFGNKVDLTAFNELSAKYDALLTQLNEILTRINS